jgi:hypothetical protein
MIEMFSVSFLSEIFLIQRGSATVTFIITCTSAATPSRTPTHKTEFLLESNGYLVFTLSYPDHTSTHIFINTESYIKGHKVVEENKFSKE